MLTYEQSRPYVDTGAARAILAVGTILHDLDAPKKERPELAILLLIRAAGWLISFAAADITDDAYIAQMLKLHQDGLKVCSEQPLSGPEGEELARLMRSLRGLNL